MSYTLSGLIWVGLWAQEWVWPSSFQSTLTRFRSSDFKYSTQHNICQLNSTTWLCFIIFSFPQSAPFQECWSTTPFTNSLTPASTMSPANLKWHTNSYFNPDSLLVLTPGNLSWPPPPPLPFSSQQHLLTLGQSISTSKESHTVGWKLLISIFSLIFLSSVNVCRYKLGGCHTFHPIFCQLILIVIFWLCNILNWMKYLSLQFFKVLNTWLMLGPFQNMLSVNQPSQQLVQQSGPVPRVNGHVKWQVQNNGTCALHALKTEQLVVAVEEHWDLLGTLM